MKLLTKKNLKDLPPLYSQEDKGGDAIAHVKFFTPDANWTWYILEYDGIDILFCLVDGQFVELGYSSLAEIKSVKGKLGLPVERDMYFDSTPLRDLACCPDWLKES